MFADSMSLHIDSSKLVDTRDGLLIKDAIICRAMVLDYEGKKVDFEYPCTRCGFMEIYKSCSDRGRYDQGCNTLSRHKCRKRPGCSDPVHIIDQGKAEVGLAGTTLSGQYLEPVGDGKFAVSTNGILGEDGMKTINSRIVAVEDQASENGTVPARMV